MTIPRERWTTDLDLNGSTSSRVQPRVGVWGPTGVPSTLRKKVMRVLAWLAFLGATAAVVGYAWWFYLQLDKQMKG